MLEYPSKSECLEWKREAADMAAVLSADTPLDEDAPIYRKRIAWRLHILHEFAENAPLRLISCIAYITTLRRYIRELQGELRKTGGTYTPLSRYLDLHPPIGANKQYGTHAPDDEDIPEIA